MEERVQKIMAHAGIGSRRACEKIIEQAPKSQKSGSFL